MPAFTLETLFPAFTDAGELTSRHVTLLQLCAEIGVPYPVERNKPYGSWWRALHEIAHWAVKPRWYVAYSQYLMDDMRAEWGRVVIPARVIPGVDEEVIIPCLSAYQAGNDVIPQIGMHDDPTPSEDETRVWSLQAIRHFGWPHPSEENVADVKVGDEFFHKPASAAVWAPYQEWEPPLRESMRRWRLCAVRGLWRPTAMPANSKFQLPCPHPRTHNELFANMAAIRAAYGIEEAGSAEKQRYWREFVCRRWPEEDLHKRWQATQEKESRVAVAA